MFFSHTCPHDGGLELAQSAIPAVLQLYNLYTPDEDDELDAGSQALLSASESNFSLALENLAVGNLTDSRFGLQWWLACPPFQDRFSRPTSASIYLNAYSVWLVESLEDLMRETGRDVRYYFDALHPFVFSAVAFVARQ